jgi:hypothetical protein
VLWRLANAPVQLRDAASVLSTCSLLVRFQNDRKVLVTRGELRLGA